MKSHPIIQPCTHKQQTTSLLTIWDLFFGQPLMSSIFSFAEKQKKKKQNRGNKAKKLKQEYLSIPMISWALAARSVKWFWIVAVHSKWREPQKEKKQLKFSTGSCLQRQLGQKPTALTTSCTQGIPLKCEKDVTSGSWITAGWKSEH